MRVTRLRAPSNHHVVAMERDVDGPEHGLDVTALGDQRAQSPRERHAACMDADERERGEIVGALDELVRESRERPRHRIRIEDLARGAARR